MSLLSQCPQAGGHLVSAFDVGVVPGWRVSFVAGMCRSERRSQFEDALDVLGVQGSSVEFLVGGGPDVSPGG